MCLLHVPNGLHDHIHMLRVLLSGTADRVEVALHSAVLFGGLLAHLGLIVKLHCLIAVLLVSPFAYFLDNALNHEAQRYDDYEDSYHYHDCRTTTAAATRRSVTRGCG